VNKAAMVLENLPTGYEIDLLINLGISLAAGFVIGIERESRNKAAGISTHWVRTSICLKNICFSLSS
jgi:uncharacterized membrane protein YhiD involved in acid resistance